MNSPPAERVLIAALSGRALATAARRDGYQPLVADLFADLDTREAGETRRVSGDLRCGLNAATLEAALAELAGDRPVLGLIYGSGFEHRPGLLRRLERRFPLLGNPPTAVRRVKNPESLARMCHRLGIPHPEIRFDAPTDGAWVVKRIGASGGGHVHPFAGVVPRGCYVQRRVAGIPISALFVASNGICTILGWSAQWADPADGAPFRFGGAVRPAQIAPAVEAAMAQAVNALAAEAGLVGLNSADFLVESSIFNLLEINPRPGATLDVFPHCPLMRMHVAALAGELIAPPVPVSAAAARVVFAPRALRLPNGFSWPDWTADRSSPHIPLQPGAPICTVLAEAEDAEAARTLVDSRAAAILSQLETDA